MKLSVSLPGRLCNEGEAVAKVLGVSRDKLVQIALKEFLERGRDEILTNSINRYIEKCGNDLSEEEEAWIAQGQETVRQFLEDESSTKRGRTAPRRQGNRR